jgi:DNA-binding MarR family transcriptional regulator
MSNRKAHPGEYLSRSGERSVSAKLSAKQAMAIRAARNQDPPTPIKALAKKYRVSITTISQIANRRRWGSLA